MDHPEFYFVIVVNLKQELFWEKLSHMLDSVQSIHELLLRVKIESTKKNEFQQQRYDKKINLSLYFNSEQLI